MPLDGLWRIFGPDTTAGRQLRELYGCYKNHQTSKEKINYPEIKSKPAKRQSSPAFSLEKPPQIQYPKFTKQTTKSERISARPTRRSEGVIRHSHTADRTNICTLPPPSKDISHEKRKLQDAFQFSSSVRPKESNHEKTERFENIRLPVIVGSWNSCPKD